MREDVEFGDCKAWLYRPEGEGPYPCVVMAHGFSLTRHDALPVFAEAFAAAGLATLVFDFRGLGDSAGADPQRFRIAEQAEDVRAAVGFARTLPQVDQNRIVLWGYSFSAGHMVNAAADDHRIAALLLLCPFLDGLARALKTPPAVTARILPKALADLAGRHVRIPVTAPVGAFGAMPLPGEYEGFTGAVQPDSPWRNEIGPGVFATIMLFRPVAKAARLGMPVWVGLGERDISVSEKAVRRLAERAPKGELTSYDADHFEPLMGDKPQAIAADQVAFLARLGLAT